MGANEEKPSTKPNKEKPSAKPDEENEEEEEEEEPPKQKPENMCKNHLVNPDDSSRDYSHTSGNDKAGTGHGQSMLNSLLAWVPPDPNCVRVQAKYPCYRPG